MSNGPVRSINAEMFMQQLLTVPSGVYIPGTWRRVNGTNLRLELGMVAIAHLCRYAFRQTFGEYPDGLGFSFEGKMINIKIGGQIHQWAVAHTPRCEDSDAIGFKRVSDYECALCAPIPIENTKRLFAQMAGIGTGSLYCGKGQIKSFLEHFSGNRKPNPSTTKRLRKIIGHAHAANC